MKAIPLSEILERSGLKQAQIAAGLRIKDPSVSRWNHNGVPLERLGEISRLTGIPLEELYVDEEAA